MTKKERKIKNETKLKLFSIVLKRCEVKIDVGHEEKNNYDGNDDDNENN